MSCLQNEWFQLVMMMIKMTDNLFSIYKVPDICCRKYKMVFAQMRHYKEKLKKCYSKQNSVVYL